MSTEDRPTVELHQAYCWTCDICGRDNFVRAVTVSPESIDLSKLPATGAEAIREWMAAGGKGDWIRMPKRVTCGHCGAEFDVARAEGDGDEGDDEDETS